MGILNIARIVVHVLATLVTLIAIGLTAAALLSSGWQIMTEPGTGEIHQHGLWLDYNRVKPHVAGAPAAHAAPLDSNHPDADHQWQWIFNYKYGKAVDGDEIHRAKDYQENALILLSVALCLAIIGALMSYCAGLRYWFGIGWAVSLFFASVLGAAALIQFYITAMLPNNRYVYTDRKIEQVMGYSFWWAVGGVIGFALAMIKSIVCVALFILAGTRGEKTERAAFTFKRGNNTQV